MKVKNWQQQQRKKDPDLRGQHARVGGYKCIMISVPNIWFLSWVYSELGRTQFIKCVYNNIHESILI